MMSVVTLVLKATRDSSAHFILCSTKPEVLKRTWQTDCTSMSSKSGLTYTCSLDVTSQR